MNNIRSFVQSFLLPIFFVLAYALSWLPSLFEAHSLFPTGPLLAALLLTGCSAEYTQSCPASTPIGLLDADEIASDNSLPFHFPLDESTVDYNLFFGWFSVSNECTPNIKDCYEFPEVEFHAAEDYKRSAGTPVYAMADGLISFSGPADGYGWLIIIATWLPTLATPTKTVAVLRVHWSRISTLGFAPVNATITPAEANGVGWRDGSVSAHRTWAGYNRPWSSPAG